MTRFPIRSVIGWEAVRHRPDRPHQTNPLEQPPPFTLTSNETRPFVSSVVPSQLSTLNAFLFTNPITPLETTKSSRHP